MQPMVTDVSVSLTELQDVVAVIAGVIAIMGALWAVIRWLGRAYLKQIKDDVAQLRHNGGSSVADNAKKAADIAAEVQVQVAGLAEKVDHTGRVASEARTEARRAQQLVDHYHRRRPMWRIR